jgi:hypothetical protein
LRFDAQQRAPLSVTRAEAAHLEPNSERIKLFERDYGAPAFEVILRWLARALAVMALLSTFALLCAGAAPVMSSAPTRLAKAASREWNLVKIVPLSALPLLLAGSSYLILQGILRPQPLELLKRLMLGAAFLLWGAVQMMPASNLAVELGNVVIALYVIDLSLILWTDLEKPRARLTG